MSRERLVETLLLYLDGQLSDEEERRLAATIRGDAEAERLLAELMRVHGNLPAVLQDLGVEESLGTRPLRRTTRRVRTSVARHAPWRAAVAALAAMILLAAGLAAFLLARPDAGRSRPEPERSVVQSAAPAAEKGLSPVPTAPAADMARQPATRLEPAGAERRSGDGAPVEPGTVVPPVAAESPVRGTLPPGPDVAPAPAAEHATSPAGAAKPPAAVETSPRSEGAVVARLEGRVLIVDGESRRPARARDSIRAGQGIQTAARSDTATVAWPDGTTLDLGGETLLSRLSDGPAEGPAAAGKCVALDRGTLAVSAARQPKGRPLVFVTPQARIEVVGTRFALQVAADATRVDVTEGRVRVAAEGRKPVEVGAGELAVAAAGRALVPARAPAPHRAGDRIVDNHEDRLAWARPTWSDPIQIALSPEQAFSGRASLKLSCVPRSPEQGGRGFGLARRPLRFAAGDAFLGCRLFVEGSEPGAVLSFLAEQRDGSAWFLGEAALERLPWRAWVDAVVPVRAAVKKNNNVGGDRYDPAEVTVVTLALFRGGSTVYVDDLTLFPSDPLALPGDR
jgi:ferric-dicitrate binding protein FerR (iron transport regulator)